MRPPRFHFVVLMPAVLGGLLLLGCDGEDAAPPTVPPTPAPTVPDESTSTSNADPAPVVEQTPPQNAAVRIDDVALEFPPAVLVLRETKDGCVALLYTDDPKEALDRNYRGHSFFFEMPLPELSVSDVLLGGTADTPAGRRLTTEFRFAEEESRRKHSGNGLFLDGGRITMEPSQADFILDPNGESLSVEVRGWFRRFEGDEAFSGEMVTVRAVLVPEIVEE